MLSMSKSRLPALPKESSKVAGFGFWRPGAGGVAGSTMPSELPQVFAARPSKLRQLGGGNISIPSTLQALY